MTNPNMLEVSKIKGENSLVSLSSTIPTLLIDNPVDSGKIYKINSIMISNVDGSTPAEISVSVFNGEDLSGLEYPLIFQVSVPNNSSLILVDKSTSFYLKENQSIGATAETANDLVVISSWEEIEV